MGLFNGRAFLLILIFSFLEIFVYYTMRYLPIMLLNSAPNYIVTTFIVILNAYSFLLHFVLFFAAFYYLCRKAIQEEPASTITSLVLGGFVGIWIGNLAATYLLIRLKLEGFNFIVGLAQLPSIMQSSFIGILVLAVAAMLSSWFVLEWDKKLEEIAFQKEMQAPFYIVLVSALYIVSGILSLCILPLVIMAISIQSQWWSLTLPAALIPLFMVNAAAQIVIAVGLYRGKRWGWLLALIASLMGICANISSAATYFQNLGLFALTIIALALNVMATMLLLTTSSRQYCRIVNPTKTIQQAEA